jgi:hypothetical protein
MVTDIRPLADGLSNVDWLNAIRNTSGSEYQARVPEATQANIQDTIQSLMQYSVGRNQFVDALINKIGLTIFANTSWSNPLAVFKRGFLNYGETIEEIMNGLVPATSYDADRDELEKEIFGRVKPEVQVNYHTVNRRDRYKVTIEEPLLRNAFLTPNGLSTFVTNLMNAAQTSDQNDEYLIMANLFTEFDKAAGDQGIYTVHVDDVGDEGSDAAASRYLLRKLRALSNTLPFISRLYNPAGMPVATNPNELVLFTTADADAAMDVEALAPIFNLSKAEFSKRKIVLPTKDFGIPGTQAILTTDKFFVAADQRIETTSIQNPAGLFNNYWLHHWGVYSASRFAPFIAFNSERPSTVISETITPVTSVSAIVITDDLGATQNTNVIRNEFYNVAAQAVTTPAGGVNDAVRYELAGNTSVFTRITNGGVLYVGPDEEANSITINVYAVDSALPQILATTSRNVTGTLALPWPNPSVQLDADADTLEEVTPIAPTFDADTDTVHIPNVPGVQYKKAGVDVNNSTDHVITASTVFTAVARTGKEITSGATVSWTFAP